MDDDTSERFDDIVKNVSDEDRKKIITRVEEMDLPDLEGNEIVDDTVSPKSSSSFKVESSYDILQSSAFRALMRKEMDNFTFFEKFIFHVQTIFLRKNQQELFRSHYLHQLEQEVSAAGNYANFETRVLTARFANELFELYKIILPLKAPLDLIWKDKKALHALITDFLDQGGASVKRNLEDFVPVEQLLDIFVENNNSDEAVRRHILRSVKGYTDSLSSIRMKEIRGEILPFFYLHKLVSYPFAEVFKMFGVSLNQIMDNNTTPSFKSSVPLSILLDYLMKLDIALTWASHLDVTESAMRYLYKTYRLQERGTENASNQSFDLASQVGDDVKTFQDALTRINRTNSRIPVTKLIQIFTQNPVYTVAQLSPRLDVRQFYSDTFKSIAIAELDDVLIQMRIAYFKRMLVKFFHKTGFTSVEFYANNFNAQWQNLVLPQFRHARSFEVMYNFLYQWIPARMHNIFALLISNVLSKSAALQIQMEEFKISLDLVEDKIKKFDKSLSFDAEAGKMLNGYKNSLNSSTIKRVKEITTFISAKDSEALSLIESAIHVLENLSNFLKNKVIDGASDTLKPIIASVYSSISRSQSLQEVLKNRWEDISIFISIMKEVIRYEKDGVTMNELTFNNPEGGAK
ncbi:hypothetical protein PVA45_00150 [Entomospira entomophila]|uniref:Uncharacterized protein n=1 Tax=Entomospira entomophila TaxID=2719988 RepID=A0A968GCH8_9SPIO|nr:hypothetical protein [Entomospira entomophilus]NIZ39934.1 hypothetical protein [Entomospira entomophilus]WDI35495.1 hypothetical protein PVA45_00150 [Entomospira entomophilus]